jgi:MraZ protein
MTSFIGEFICKLDAKARLMVPSGLKKQLDPAAQEKFVINRGFEGCLVLYPMNEWEKITARLKKLNLFVEKNRRFYRQFHNGATPLTLDGSGRVLLPRTLMNYAAIKKDIVLFAYADRIEVWSKSRYDEMLKEGADDFAGLAEDVMGGLEEDDDQ